jgi:hypothetical protein
MAIPLIKHKFHSDKGDGPDGTLVRPTDWNKEHSFDLTGPAIIGALAAGPAQELPLVTTGVGDDGTIWTKDAIEAAIAAAVASASFWVTGDLSTSMVSSKPSWLLCDGKTIGNTLPGVADYIGPQYQNLFTLLWQLNASTWPVLPVPPGRGASALDDWNAAKMVPLPDARGAAFAQIDLAHGINTLVQKLGVVVGEQNHVLQNDELPQHAHATGPFGSTYSGNSAVGGLFGYMVGNNLSGITGNVGNYTPHNNVQPTMGVNLFIRI